MHNLPSADHRSPSPNVTQRRPPPLTTAHHRPPPRTVAYHLPLSRYHPFYRPREKGTLKRWIRVLSLRRMRTKRKQRVHFILRQPKNTPDLAIGGAVVIAESFRQIDFLSLAQLLEAADTIG